MAQRGVTARPLMGWREWVLLPDLSPIPMKAKIDTGARTSSLHAVGLSVLALDGQQWAEFEINPVQRSRDGRATVRHPIVGYKRVRSSTGHSETRPVITTSIRIGHIGGYSIDLTLTSRDEMGFRLLLGRAAVRHRFSVDPGRSFLNPILEMKPLSKG